MAALKMLGDFSQKRSESPGALDRIGGVAPSPSDTKKQIAVRMPLALFAQLKMQAVKEKTSIQKKLMDYISVGLQVDRDWDVDEPERHEKKQAVTMTIWDF